MSHPFWRGRRVFLTGHTGFKGSWLSQWLAMDGAVVTGYALTPPTEPSLFVAARLDQRVTSVIGDVRDADALRAALEASDPEIVLHLAGQSLVRRSYVDAAGTYATNVMGTVNLLEAIRATDSVRVALVITSDKCYENGDASPDRPFREDDALGGHDPYASSKACAELVVDAYRRSFFEARGVRIASARAGNVIGGGDFAEDRLVPDLVRAFSCGETASIRNPHATRPWQFVLDALQGYRMLAEALGAETDLPHAWNFGADDARPVRWLADLMARRWGGAEWSTDAGAHPHEAPTLALDSTRAKERLGWRSRVDGEAAVEWTTDWYRRWIEGEDAAALVQEQIRRFEAIR